MDDSEQLVGSIAQRLKEAMVRRQVSNADLAEAMGVHVKTVSAWRAGNQVPSDAALEKLGQVLNLSPDWYLIRKASDHRVARPVITTQAEFLARLGKEFYPATPIPTVAFSARILVWQKEFELELAKMGADEETIINAINLVRAPQVFAFFRTGTDKSEEMTEERALDAMKAMARVVRTALTGKATGAAPAPGPVKSSAHVFEKSSEANPNKRTPKVG